MPVRASNRFIDCYRRGCFVLEAKSVQLNRASQGAKIALRGALGDAYVETLRAAHPDVPDSADLVMFWWHKAAERVAAGKLRRFGFITTNSLRQTFNRRVLEKHLDKLQLAFAIPDHPWVENSDGAAVRIAMTVACLPSPASGGEGGRLAKVSKEREGGGEGLEVILEEKRGLIHADLTIGANVAAAQALRTNESISSPGFKLHGAGFIVTPDERRKLEADAPIFDYRNGKDLTDRPRGVRLIDLYGFEADEVRRRWPATYQHVLETVKPERDNNRDPKLRDNWWLHRRLREDLRAALAGLPRYIATVETAKHRVFQFLDASIAPDNKLICIALDDAWFLGVLSSRVHVVWALAQGSHLGVGNDPVYVKSRCFETFPFPDFPSPQPSPARGGGGGGEGRWDWSARIRDLAEQLDAHRKRVLAAHPELTLTGLYNVLEKLRSGAALNAKEQRIHELGLVAVLKSFHDDLDAAVLAAYGWSGLLPSPASKGGAGGEGASDEIILDRLGALNAARAREEAQGQVRWLRPDFQHPQATPQQQVLEQTPSEPAAPAAAPDRKIPWPAELPAQMAAIAGVLSLASGPLTLDQLAGHFSGKGAWKKRLPQLVETLVALGRAHQGADGNICAAGTA